MKILSIELSKLTSKFPEFTAKFLNLLLTQIPGKIHERYWLVNTDLTISDKQDLPIVPIFNIFVKIAAAKNYQLIQITKN